MGVQISPWEEAILVDRGTFWRELCKNGWADRFAVWVVDSDWPNEAQVQSCLPGGANVPTCQCAPHVGTLVPPGEYDWTVRLRQWCGLMSNYFDHLFSWIPSSFSAPKQEKYACLALPDHLLWLPYGIGQTIIFSSCGFFLAIYLLLFFLA